MRARLLNAGGLLCRCQGASGKKLGPRPFFTLAHDWVCQIHSPATRRFDLTEKRDLYARAGVTHLWLVDPDARTLEAFALLAGAWTLAAAFQDGDDIRTAPFEALTFPLNAVAGLRARAITGS